MAGFIQDLSERVGAISTPNMNALVNTDPIEPAANVGNSFTAASNQYAQPGHDFKNGMVIPPSGPIREKGGITYLSDAKLVVSPTNADIRDHSLHMQKLRGVGAFASAKP